MVPIPLKPPFENLKVADISRMTISGAHHPQPFHRVRENPRRVKGSKAQRGEKFKVIQSAAAGAG